MPITSKRTSAEDADNYDDEIDLPGPDAEQRARMRAGPRDKRKPEPDFKDEAFANDVYSRFNAKNPSDESRRSAKREAAEDE